VGLLFQEGALFPHMTVGQNVAFGMRDRRRGDLTGMLERFGLRALGRERVARLSGGERQRVALARAVASEPEALLLDEPLSALDAVTKSTIAGELTRHLRALALPTILVSHDYADVVGLADRVAVMEAGRIAQTGTAADLLAAPVSPFVAALTGVNWFRGVAARRGDLTVVRAQGSLLLSTEPVDGPVAAVVSPWDVALSFGRPEGSALNALAGPVVRLSTIGNRSRVTVGSRPAIVAEVTEESARRLGLGPGVAVVATWKATGTRLVPARD
jgi:molybdate transport system ATP-binding protein